MHTSPAKKKLVLFYRDFQRFTGGHLKVWNYFNHVLASKTFEPRIAFTPSSKWDDTNPWTKEKNYIVDWDPQTADVLFLAGKDWAAVSQQSIADPNKPIINLIQHPRHADPNNSLFEFLKNRAIRICVSQQTADAINQTGQVNGPVFTIPNGIDLDDIPAASDNKERPIDLLICGLKAPELSRQIAARFRQDENVTVIPLLDWLPRPEYLRHLVQAKVVVTLPRPREGFYLPALEAMACGGIVVCPDCVGNRDFCQNGVNCFRPDYDADGTVGAIYQAFGLAPGEISRMKEAARDMVREHSIARERTSFLQILQNVNAIWKQ